MNILVFAVMVEAVVNTAKWAYDRALNLWRVAAIVLGVLLAVVYQVDFLAAAGIHAAWPQADVVGQVLTGIVLARGANVAHDLFRTIEGVMQGQEPPAGAAM